MKFIRELLENFNQVDWKQLWEDADDVTHVSTREMKPDEEFKPDNYKRMIRSFDNYSVWYWTCDVLPTGLARLHDDPEVQKQIMQRQKKLNEDDILETFVVFDYEHDATYFLGTKYNIVRALHGIWRAKGVDSGTWHDIQDEFFDKLDGREMELADVVGYTLECAKAFYD